MKRLMMTTAAFGLLAACEAFDSDLRGDFGSGFDTSSAIENLPDRPRPDASGLITYPNYQVVVARSGDTMRTIAARVGQDADTLARFNGIETDTALRQGEVVALPSAAILPSTQTQPTDITAIAGAAIDRAGPETVATTTLDPAPVAAPSTPVQSGTAPIRHKVLRGETAFSISRLYNVPVRNIAEWNSLGSDLAIREGQFLLIPQGDTPAPTRPEPVAEPGVGSATPVPPSAAAPLPTEVPTPAATAPTAQETPEAPDLGEVTQPTASNSARLVMPAQGTIVRDYAAGRNEGIDISLTAGAPVVAADAGTVAAVTKDTSGIAIVVIKHAGNLLTVYTNLEDLSVEKGSTVSRGQSLGKIRGGDQSILHFEVRQGLQSVDPKDFLP